MRRALVLGFVAISGLAHAGPKKLLVLHADGTADTKLRAKVDTAILKLAKAGPDTVTPSEITFAEATAMVGCKAEEASCRDEVINTLAVDELLIVNVNPKPPGFEVSVRRAGKGGAIHDASTVITADKPEKVEALGPLFGLRAPAIVEPPVTKPPTVEPPPVTKPPGVEPRPPIDTNPPVANPPNDKVPDLHPPIKPEPTVKPEPIQSDRQPKDRRRLYLSGMAGGGGMLFLGIILWSAASSTQGQIDSVTVRNAADLQHLKDLEGRGDSLSNWGNGLFIGGLIVAGVSTYFYVKNRHTKRETRSALITPTLFDHGGGLTLTFGGSR